MDIITTSPQLQIQMYIVNWLTSSRNVTLYEGLLHILKAVAQTSEIAFCSASSLALLLAAIL